MHINTCTHVLHGRSHDGWRWSAPPPPSQQLMGDALLPQPSQLCCHHCAGGKGTTARILHWSRVRACGDGTRGQTEGSESREEKSKVLISFINTPRQGSPESLPVPTACPDRLETEPPVSSLNTFHFAHPHGLWEPHALAWPGPRGRLTPGQTPPILSPLGRELGCANRSPTPPHAPPH